METNKMTTQTELSIAEKLIKGCNKIEYFSEFNCDLKCIHYVCLYCRRADNSDEKKFILCDKCQGKVQVLKSSCQRFLGLVIDLQHNYNQSGETRKRYEDIQFDLKSAIQKYNEAGIK